MSILIKGVEMPQNGETITITICDDGVVFEERKEPGRVFKAIPVPPHGRLSDADVLYRIMEKCSDYYGATGYHDNSLIHRDDVLYAIEQAPTIIPVEERET